MNVGSLFSGVGGMDYGLHRAGLEHVFFCEADEWRRRVLAARWPGAPVYDDVRAVGVESAARAAVDGRGPGGDGAGRVHADAVPDLLCGGFPCQDLSVAGRRRGLAGERSGLFFEFARVIDAFRPGWVLVENVPGLLSSQGGRDFGVVLGTLADLGYGVAWRVLDSRFFGVPQRRRRVFIVGARAVGDPRAAAERAGQVLAVGTRCPGHPAAGGEAREDIAVASLSGLGTGGPDDNDAQGGRVIAETLREHPRPGSNSNGQIVVGNTLKSQRGKGGGIGPEETLLAFDTYNQTTDAHTFPTLRDPNGTFGDALPAIAAPLTKGSAIGEGVNAPGRRQEDDVNIVAFNASGGGEKDLSPRDNLANHVTGSNGDPGAIASAMGVRRLTARECERLQGLPDDWTRLDDKTPDSRRYSALGDAVTATVAEWIGRRIKAAA